MLSLLEKHKDAYYHGSVAVKIAHFQMEDLIEFTECMAYWDSFSEWDFIVEKVGL